MSTGAPAPVVSVVVVTYQHEAFIAACLDGILAQRCDFPIEVLVGEDASTDGTRAICERYAAAHPDRIRLFLRDGRDKIWIDGRPTGRRNFHQLLTEARGEFVAFCEGDDAWMDPLKLQRQMEALRADPAASGCFTAATVLRDDGSSHAFYDGRWAKLPPSPLRLDAFIQGQSVATCTVMLRREGLLPLPPVWMQAPGADTLMWLHMLVRGHFIYLPEPMAAYRVHGGGIFSSRTKVQQLKARILTMQAMAGLLKGDRRALVRRRIRRVMLEAWPLAVAEGEQAIARLCWKGLAAHRREAGWNLTTTLRNGLKAYLPRLERALFRGR